MDRGLVHLYSGAGKGKTTAAMGLAIRAIGRGKTVMIVQFLKDGTSGELEPLRTLGAAVLAGPPGTKFVSRMSEAELRETRDWNDQNMRQAIEADCDLLILDELCAARRHNLVDADMAKSAVLDRPRSREVVITGRDPEPWMLEAADYSTEMVCHRHPFLEGIAAREGIEY